jgi:hypothetical protein
MIICEGSFLPSVFDPQTKEYRVAIEPSLLSNQALRGVAKLGIPAA